MAKIWKAVFRSSVVMLSLLAAIVLSSSVAYAQDCRARASGANTVRAEGVTEAVGGIELSCKATEPDDFFPDPPETFTVSIELNTSVTNETDDDVVMGLSYDGDEDTPGEPELGDARDYMGEDREVLDGNTIEWKLMYDIPGDGNTDGIMFPLADGMPGSVIIGGILANASAVGDGEDVTAVVRVNGEVVHEGALKLSDVTTGLDITVTGETGLQCGVGSVTAIVNFVEGFASAIAAAGIDEEAMPMSLVLNFRGIPDGVTVMVSRVGTGMAMEDDESDLAPLMLDVDAAAMIDEGVEYVEVDLDDGAGKAVYTFAGQDPEDDVGLTGTDDEVAKEWNEVKVMFTWEAGMPALGGAYVSVGYDPVGGDDDDIPRYAAGVGMHVLAVEECITSLLFPFVTNGSGYDTGIAITNTSEADGTCMVEWFGANAPADGMVEVMAESTQTFAVSVMAPAFQGYADITCDYTGGQGFAFITNGYGSMGGPTAAQGYLVADDLRESD